MTDGVDLIDHQNNRSILGLQVLSNKAVSASCKLIRFHQPQDQIHPFKGSGCNLGHVLSQLVLGLVNTRSIQKHHLATLIRIDCLNTVTGGLGFVGCNGDLLTDHMIHKC